jgi:hypothetical protein
MARKIQLKLEPIQHKYFDLETGDEYLSVTTFLHRFEPEFDEQKISYNYALKHGRTQEDVLAEWKRVKDEASDWGTRIHNSLEAHLKNELIDKHNDIDSNKLIYNLHKVVDVNAAGAKLLPECIVYDEDCRMCGTADLPIIYPDTKIVDVEDYKTNKKGIDFRNKYNKTLLYPLNHLEHTKFNMYAMQLSLYSYFFEKRGYQPRNRRILWIHPTTFQFIPILCPYLRDEVEAILAIRKQELKIK